jgi:hypothetical protein
MSIVTPTNPLHPVEKTSHHLAAQPARFRADHLIHASSAPTSPSTAPGRAACLVVRGVDPDRPPLLTRERHLQRVVAMKGHAGTLDQRT